MVRIIRVLLNPNSRFRKQRQKCSLFFVLTTFVSRCFLQISAQIFADNAEQSAFFCGEISEKIIVSIFFNCY
jgi:hypothetical protein